MTDIVERLAEEAANKSHASFSNGCVLCGVASNLLEDAAAEIERLRAALDRIAYEHYYEPVTARGIARAALSTQRLEPRPPSEGQAAEEDQV